MPTDLHYLTDHYKKKIESLNALDAPLNFLFITDMHNRLHELAYRNDSPEHQRPFELAVNAIDSIQYILDRCPGIAFVVSGGDIGNDYDPDPARVRASHHEVMDALYRLSVPVHCCIGNHDDATEPFHSIVIWLEEIPYLSMSSLATALARFSESCIL